MQEKMSKPEETAASSEGTNDRAQDSAAGQAPEENGRAAVATSEDCACDKSISSPCNTDSQTKGCSKNDFDYMVTPFPEHISNYLFFSNLYAPWVLLSVVFVAIRISAMAICGEEPGRFTINIAFSLLPGIQAILIIAYSKRTEDTTKTFCGMADPKEEKRIIDEYTKLVRRAFSNTGMLIAGVVFIALFWPMMETGRLYPTPSHNILHRQEVRDRIMVTMGVSWKAQSSALGTGTNTDGQTKDSTWGWVELPLGKVLKMGRDMELSTPTGQEDNYIAITRPPLEEYESLAPPPTFDENIDHAKSTVRHAIDPDWNTYSPEMARLRGLKDGNRLLRDPNMGPDEIRAERVAKEKKLKEEKEEWKDKRVAHLIRPLAAIYVRTEPADRWLLSQATYKMVMLPLLFMSGAMLWCLAGITWLTWTMGRAPKDGEQSVWQAIKVGVHPRLSRSVREVGKNLWYVAVITGGLYTIVMICMFFAQPDTLTLTVASLFSLLVVAIFIVPQFNMHQLMVEAKDRRMTHLNEQLDSALEQMQERQDAESTEKANAIIELQKALGDCCEWPYDFKSLMLVVGSVIIPVLMAIFTLYEHFK